MFNPFRPFLDRCGVVILDGGLATELERGGADLHDPLWSAKALLEMPDLVRKVHAAYFVAGADVATTATYQASFAGFARRGLDAEASADLMRLSVRLAQEARESFWSDPAQHTGRLRPLIAASIGCYGAVLHDGSEYRGDYGLTCAQLEDFHRPRVEVLARSGADLLACETIPCQVEAEALVRLLAEFQVPAWMSFSCADDRHVCHGESLADCIAAAAACEQVVAVGINCTSPRFVSRLLHSLASVTHKDLLVYPNRGDIWEAPAQCWVPGPDSVSDWGQAAREWHASGARILGGCCRTTTDDIQRLAATRRCAKW